MVQAAKIIGTGMATTGLNLNFPKIPREFSQLMLNYNISTFASSNISNRSFSTSTCLKTGDKKPED